MANVKTQKAGENMAIPSKFPKFIQVTRENDNTEDAYWRVTTGQPEDALTTTDKTRVATYELKEVKEGKLEPVFSTIVG
jgi:hypothetical protein